MSMLFLVKDLIYGYYKFYSYFFNGDNIKFYNVILKYVELGVFYLFFYYDGDWYGKN